jgi:hypothetical protein
MCVEAEEIRCALRAIGARDFLGIVPAAVELGKEALPALSR